MPSDDLVAWLRTKIAQDRDLYELAAKRPRSNKPILQSMLDRGEAYTAILDLHQPGERVGCCECAAESKRIIDDSDPYNIEAEYYRPYPCRTLRMLALAYKHRAGYRLEWKP